MPDSSGNLERILAKAVAEAPEGGLSRSGSKKRAGNSHACGWLDANANSHPTS